MQRLGNDLGVMKSKERGQGRSWSPEMAVNLSLIKQYAGSQTQNDVHLLLCQTHKQDNRAAP